ncbi:hypothetical protein FA13DRAFT_1794592 [Coprinellus micaceus]|uniref:DUF6533 domain-containing protein n=1 Tax=Coprinellus micaceus TaxID=71717 RepID=A0A4Y7T1X6_COPMI|nr:hypothetical protein FA13DRAFT_1794592 [Coprinellus micaceus]
MDVASPDMAIEVGRAILIKWVTAACSVCIIYNHALTLGDEVACIWPGQLSLAKLLFFTNRYAVEGVLLFNCLSASRTFEAHYSNRLLAVSYFVYFGGAAVCVGLMGKSFTATNQGVTTNTHVQSYLPGCYTVKMAPALFGTWCVQFGWSMWLLARFRSHIRKAADGLSAGRICGLLVESYLFVVTVAPYASYCGRSRGSTPRIIVFLVTDSTVYFVM